MLRRGLGIEPKHAVDNMIGADFVRRVEVSRLSRRLEGPDDDSGRVRAQIQALAVQEFGVGQRCSLEANEMNSCRCRWMIILTRVWSEPLPQWPRAVVSLPEREDTIARILHPCSHWSGRDEGHPNSFPCWDRSAPYAGHSRQETRRTHASRPASILRCHWRGVRRD